MDLDEAVVEDGDVGLQRGARFGGGGELDDGGLRVDDLEREEGEKGNAHTTDRAEAVEVVAEHVDLRSRRAAGVRRGSSPPSGPP